ncbi:MAG: Fur family transcriptional regulator [Anaerolineales bacterium]|jgi:Fur family ferric uptake transcriptional regulator
MNESYESKLRSHGYRMTPQREMIIEILSQSEQHITAEEIYGTLQTRTRSLNIATVYRTLDLLVGLGLAFRNDLGCGKVFYAPKLHGPHIHLVCRRCGRVIDADSDLIAPLGPQILEKYGFTTDLKHVSFYGECQECDSGRPNSE